MSGIDPLVMREIAGYVAPILRSASPAAVSRRVKVYRQETGEVTGETTIGEALRGLAEAYGLEHAVEGRQKATPCERCGRPVPAPARGIFRRFCELGAGCGLLVCSGCGLACTNKLAMSPANVKRRGDGPWFCVACNARRQAPKGRASPEAMVLGRALTDAERSRKNRERIKAAKAVSKQETIGGT